MKAKMYFLLSMIIFGAVGIFAKYISLDSCQIAFFLSLIGSLFLLGIILYQKHKIPYKVIKKNLFLLSTASIALSGNWIFLFQAYKKTTIANAALSYYMAPILVILIAPLILHEKFSLKKMLCTCTSLLGLFLILEKGLTGNASDSFTGILYGLIAAAFYAALTIINKLIQNLDGLINTCTQLLMAAILLAAYMPLSGTNWGTPGTTNDVLLLLILGICHGGIGFYLFFTGMQALDGQSIALLSYVDPLTSIFLSVLCLGEPMALQQYLGIFLLFGSIWIAEKEKPKHSYAADSDISPSA